MRRRSDSRARERRLNWCRAFSLVEALTVMLLIGLLAGIAGLSLRAACRATRLSDAKARILSLDQLLRQSSRHCGDILALRIDVRGGTVVRVNTRTGDTIGTRLELGTQCRIAQVIQPAVPHDGNDVVLIRCSPYGHTSTYAIRLSDNQNRELWLAVAGLTGRVIEVNNEQDVAQVFEAINGRHDAD